MSGGMGQDCYWVIGPRTDAGKTTIATALVRQLNRRGCPALGFKPYSATLLADLVDRIHDPGADAAGRILGEDATSLARSSPLTEVADAECIVPVQYVCHPNYHRAVVARVGSATIGERRILRCDRQGACLGRADVVALFIANGTPIGEMEPADHLMLSTAPSLGGDLVDKSYRLLAARDGVAATVCEGAGPFLPSWSGMPVVDHVVQLDEGVVRFFPNIRLNLAGEQRETLHAARTIERLLAGRQGLSAAFPLVPSDRREPLADEVVERLLDGRG
jgi:hypothetical protein